MNTHLAETLPYPLASLNIDHRCFLILVNMIQSGWHVSPIDLLSCLLIHIWRDYIENGPSEFFCSIWTIGSHNLPIDFYWVSCIYRTRSEERRVGKECR